MFQVFDSHWIALNDRHFNGKGWRQKCFQHRIFCASQVSQLLIFALFKGNCLSTQTKPFNYQTLMEFDFLLGFKIQFKGIPNQMFINIFDI